MGTTEDALKERIKELTCLYEVSSIIGNADTNSIEATLKAIAISLKKAFQFSEETDVVIQTDQNYVVTNRFQESPISIVSDILIFNRVKGKIIVYMHQAIGNEECFLKEEQLLLENIALKVGNLLERFEILRNETSLKRQMERADRLAILGEMTAGIAHELNTPLANILGFAELLKGSLEGKSKFSEDVDKIIKNAIFSREVVKKLMFFACEMPQEMKRVNIVPIIKNAINLLETTFRKEHVKYVVKIEMEELYLKADPIQLTQIMFNLLMNAIYFSPKEGLVTIEANQSTKDIILKISDEGKGFELENLDKVFQPFFTTKPIGEGSGLGLSVVHGIVTSHKGEITAENIPNKGAIFTVKLPKNI